ncbi:MAG: Y-family DNA polymerase [Vagococcus salmoninarum]|uniref:Y-family DNA polymerase n=1 Tax=Vagococcus salmoninarum TaxID=2739 RepID=UPI003F97DCEF
MYYNYENEPSQVILCIDMKSFYASVECLHRNLDPLTTLLVVMSNAESNGGLVLAASPAAKKELGISNVTRKFDLPDHPDLYVVPPRMTYYIQKNMEIAEIIRRHVADEDFYAYSIDEFFVDLTKSYQLFGKTPYDVAHLIKSLIFAETGLHCTIGIGDNPLLAKLALDIEAKHNADFIAQWHYQDVAETIWKIENLTDMWGIGTRTALRLNKLGINSVYDLAHSDRYRLKERLGMIGEQLYAHAWGIDRSQLNETYQPLEKSYSNSQVLMRDYTKQAEIEVILREMADQVATRLRRHHCQTECLSLFVGFAEPDYEGKASFSRQMKIPMTNNSLELANYCLILFNKHWRGQTLRHLGLSYTKLVYHSNIQLDLFTDSQEQLNAHRLEYLVDKIRQKYGFTALVHANSLMPGGTAIKRSTLVGGHAGGLDGL